MGSKWECWRQFNCLKESDVDFGFSPQRRKMGYSEGSLTNKQQPPLKDVGEEMSPQRGGSRAARTTMTGAAYPLINEDDLRTDKHYSSYSIGNYSTMTSKIWLDTRVTVRTGKHKHCKLLQRELSALSNLKHPNILLLMGLLEQELLPQALVFEHVQLGSLYSWIHEKKRKVPSLKNCVDILLQVGDALIFIHSRGFLHCSISSHSIQLVNSSVAKLASLEFSVRESDTDRNLLKFDVNWYSLHYWQSSEVLAGRNPTRASDIYSLCAVIWELCTGRVPWLGLTPREVHDEMVGNGRRLPVDRSTMPPHLYQVMKQGLVQGEERDLDLYEIRDMLLITRRDIEVKEGGGVGGYSSYRRARPQNREGRGHNHHHPQLQQSASTDPHHQFRQAQPRNSVLSRSCIQLGRYGMDRYVQQDYSFVSHPAKREFLMSQPVSPDRQGLGGRSMSSLYSCSEGIDLSSGESSPELRAISASSSSCDSSSSDRDRKSSGAKSSDSGIQLRPSSGSMGSGIRAGDHLQQVFSRGVTELRSSPEEKTNHYRLPENYRRKSALFASMRSRRSCQTESRERESRRSEVSTTRSYHQSRSRSVPRASHSSGRPSYETGIKPASHRISSHAPTCSTNQPVGHSKAAGDGSPLSAPKSPPDHVRLSLFQNNNNAKSSSQTAKKSSDESVGDSCQLLYETAQELPSSCCSPETAPQVPPYKANCTSVSEKEAIAVRPGPPARFPNILHRKSTGNRNHPQGNPIQPLGNPKHPPGKKCTMTAKEKPFTFTSLWFRKPVEPVVKGDNCNGANENSHDRWALSRRSSNENGGVKNIVQNLEGVHLYPIPSTSDTTTTSNNNNYHTAVVAPATSFDTFHTVPPTSSSCSSPAIPIPGTAAAHFLHTKQEFQSSAERVSDILRRPLPGHGRRRGGGGGGGESGGDGAAGDGEKRGAAKLWNSNRSSLDCEELQSIAALKKATLTDPGCPPSKTVSHVERQTARIIRVPTQKAKLHTVRTSTPLDHDKLSHHHHPDTQGKGATLRQEAFCTALQDACRDTSNETEVGRVESSELNSSTSSYLSPPHPPASSFSRESFDTVIDSTQPADHSSTVKRPGHTQVDSGPHSILENTGVWETFRSAEVTTSVLKSPQLGRRTDAESLRKQSNDGEDTLSTNSMDMRRSRLLHSRLSTISARSSFSGGSFPETEDLYCDDELHPSLENDPNMQLVCAALLTDYSSPDGSSPPEYRDPADHRLFESLDGDSVLSMEIPSTGPQSLRSEYNIDIDAANTSDKEGDGGGASVSAQYITADGFSWGNEEGVDEEEEEEEEGRDTPAAQTTRVEGTSAWGDGVGTGKDGEEEEEEEEASSQTITPVEQPNTPVKRVLCPPQQMVM